MVLGHDLNEGQRTQDVRISEDVSFDTMLLRTPTLKGLKKAGFLKPSPIQLHGIPLGKCGFDLLLEAKSGTGKTGVFTVIALEKIDLELGVQTIVLAPTREIASQISAVITDIGSQYKDINVAVVMGGLPFKEDVEKLKCNTHIVVGSPGRLRHLIHQKYIDVSSVRLFVLDEADKLMENSFQPDINYIFSLLPKQKQVIMASATYPEETKLFIQKYVKKAQHVCPDSNSVLLGIEQKVTTVPNHSNIVKQTKHRYDELKKILTGKQFKQCLIFCNYQVRVGELHRMLSRDKWPVEQLYGLQEQTDRLDALKTLQEYKCRILVSTDLAARGIDAPNVDVVINFEPPFEWQTYLHRIGRAGRYGSYGTAISILSEGKDKIKFKEMLRLSNMPLDLRDFWNDEPFNLSLSITDDSLEENKSVMNSPKIMNSQINDEKGEDLLWKVLTTDSSEEKDGDSHEVPSFEGLCESFQLSSKPHIETFSDLVHSFTVNNNKVSKPNNNYKYKHVEFTKILINNEYLNRCEAPKTNKICDPSNGDTLGSKNDPQLENYELNGHSASEKTQLSKIKGIESTDPIPNSKQNIPGENIHIVSCSAIDKADLQESDKPKQSSSNGNQSDDTGFDPMEQALLDSGLPTAFGKPKNKNNYSNRSHNISYKSYNKYGNTTEGQCKPLKFHNNYRKEIKNNPHKATKDKHHKIGLSNNVSESDQSELSSDTDEESQQSNTFNETSSDEQPNHKLNNYYLRYESNTLNRNFNQNSKRYSKSQTQNRNKQFDLWYSQLKRQMKLIQYALYIEELRKLCVK